MKKCRSWQRGAVSRIRCVRLKGHSGKHKSRTMHDGYVIDWKPAPKERE